MNHFHGLGLLQKNKVWPKGKVSNNVGHHFLPKKFGGIGSPPHSSFYKESLSIWPRKNVTPKGKKCCFCMDQIGLKIDQIEIKNSVLRTKKPVFLMGTIWRNKGYSPAPFAENIFGGKPKGWHNLMSLTLVTHTLLCYRRYGWRLQNKQRDSPLYKLFRAGWGQKGIGGIFLKIRPHSCM